MERKNFTAKTRNLLASSAGYQCSFPTCNRRTIGPGASSTESSNSGYACHIYAASSGGPRGQGHLSTEELKCIENGIWLCGIHAKLIDNNRGDGYPPELLLSYKALHEARIQLEHDGLYPPIGWLHELVITQGPLFSTPQKIQLAKLNLIYGANATGKSAIVEWIAGFFEPTPLERWTPTKKQPLSLQLSILNPKLQKLGLSANGQSLQYSIDGKSVAFIPHRFKIFKPNRLDYSIPDDREMLAKALGIPTVTISALAEEINTFPHAKVTNLYFERDKDDMNQYILRADVLGTAPNLSFRALSSRESECVLIEFVTAAARLSGRECPTLLVLDGCISIIFEEFFEFYSNHLLNPLNQFQTLMCIAERNLNLDNVKWNGWKVIRTSGKKPNINLLS